jgi:outer membrane protein TolC
LFDQAPAAGAQERTLLPEDPLPIIGAGIPAQILANRPDLMAAEWRLREASSQVDATRASFYPVLSLTGGLGTASTGLLDILRNPFAALGAGLAFPFVQLPTARLTTQVSESQYQESVVAFRQSLYSALAEVENLLSARTQLAADEALQRAAVAQARRAEAIARVRFEAGASDVQLWLDAQQRVRTVERSLLANRLNQFDVQADLYRALGLGIAAERLNCAAS